MNELDLFTSALALSDPAERGAYLDRECADNPDLRRRLARLEQGEVARGQTAGQALRAETAATAEKTARKATLDKIRKHYTPALEARMFADYFGTLDEKRRAEGVDAMWAGDMSALFRRGAGGDGLSPRLVGRLSPTAAPRSGDA